MRTLTLSLSLTLLLTLILTLAGGTTQAQGRRDTVTSHRLTVFAQEGERFFLILDGERVNPTPLARVRVPGRLTRPYYKAKIIFDNDKIPHVDANLQLEGVDPGYNDVTYVIRRVGRGSKARLTLRPYSFVELGGRPNRDEDRDEPHTLPSVTQVEQPGQRRPTIHQADPTSIEFMTGPYVIPGPSAPPTIAPGTGGPGPIPPGAAPNQPPASAVNCPPMSAQELEISLKALNAESFSSNRIQTARQILSAYCVTTAQVKQLIGAMNFEDNRLELAKMAWPRTVDRARYFELNEAFQFSTTRQQLQDWIAAQK